jgi:hypothetical protein
VITSTSWWCSDGSYNLVATGSTDGATASTFKALKNDFVAAADTTNLIIADIDRRSELFYAACRQKQTICGSSLVEATSSTTAVNRAPV